MELARETLINAQGWNKFNEANNAKVNQEHIDFAHTVNAAFRTADGKKILNAMVERYLLCDIASNADTQIAIGRKQGRADVVKYILSQIELSEKNR